MSFKQRLKFLVIVMTKSLFVLVLRLGVTTLDAVYRAGVWLGPHIKTGVAKLINLKRKVMNPYEQSTTTTCT